MDPAFALAHASRSIVASRLASMTGDEAWTATAEASAREARRLAPHMAETELALGLYRLWANGRADDAMPHLERARKANPGDPRALEALAQARRQQGDLEGALSLFEDVMRTDPFRSTPVVWAAHLNGRMRRFEREDLYLRRATSLDPSWTTLYVRHALSRLRAGSSSDEALAILRQGALNTAASVPELALLSRELGRVIGPLTDWHDVDPFSMQFTEDRIALSVGKAWLLAAEGRRDEARALYRDVVEELAPSGDAGTDHGDGAGMPAGRARAWLGLALAELGRPLEAAALAEAVLAANPPDANPAASSYLRVAAAEVLARAGRVDRALDIIEEQMARPSTVTQALLRADPVWSGLRDRARFRALAGLGG